MTNNQWINSFDYEREAAKDAVYLLEARMIEEQEYRDWLTEKDRKPALIEIIDEDKILKKQDDYINVLPF